MEELLMKEYNVAFWELNHKLLSQEETRDVARARRRMVEETIHTA